MYLSEKFNKYEFTYIIHYEDIYIHKCTDKNKLINIYEI